MSCFFDEGEGSGWWVMKQRHAGCAYGNRFWSNDALDGYISPSLRLKHENIQFT